MQIKIYKDILYPYYSLADDEDETVEIDLQPEAVEWVVAIEKEFRKMQDLLRAIYQGDYE